MRHNKKFNHLGRTASHRRALLANMAVSLIMHKRITTTVAKAKALKKYVEPLLTKSKNDTTNSRRVVFSYLHNKYAVTELFKEISVKIADRPGGYTRIIKTGTRLGDAAEMCFIELVDYNENMLGGKAKKTRTRRSRKKKATDGAEVENTQNVETTAAETAAPAAGSRRAHAGRSRGGTSAPGTGGRRAGSPACRSFPAGTGHCRPVPSRCRRSDSADAFPAARRTGSVSATAGRGSTESLLAGIRQMAGKTALQETEGKGGAHTQPSGRVIHARPCPLCGQFL